MPSPTECLLALSSVPTNKEGTPKNFIEKNCHYGTKCISTKCKYHRSGIPYIGGIKKTLNGSRKNNILTKKLGGVNCDMNYIIASFAHAFNHFHMTSCEFTVRSLQILSEQIYNKFRTTRDSINVWPDELVIAICMMYRCKPCKGCERSSDDCLYGHKGETLLTFEQLVNKSGDAPFYSINEFFAFVEHKKTLEASAALDKAHRATLLRNIALGIFPEDREWDTSTASFAELSYDEAEAYNMLNFMCDLVTGEPEPSRDLKQRKKEMNDAACVIQRWRAPVRLHPLIKAKKLKTGIVDGWVTVCYQHRKPKNMEEVPLVKITYDCNECGAKFATNADKKKHYRARHLTKKTHTKSGSHCGAGAGSDDEIIVGGFDAYSKPSQVIFKTERINERRASRNGEVRSVTKWDISLEGVPDEHKKMIAMCLTTFGGSFSKISPKKLMISVDRYDGVFLSDAYELIKTFFSQKGLSVKRLALE